MYNSGRFRMAGRGSLAGMMPYSDANQVVVEMVISYLLYIYSTNDIDIPLPTHPPCPQLKQ